MPGPGNALNAALAGRALDEACYLEVEGQKLLSSAMERLGLSARALHRILRVARTLADLDGATELQRQHLIEALGYRQLDRQHGQNSLVSA